MKPSKVIVATDQEYTPGYEPLLNTLYERGIELFCAWGNHSKQWHLAMDVFVTDPARFDESRHVTTITLGGATLADAINEASCWSVESGNNEVEVIKL